MTEFFPAIDLRQDQAEAIARGLFAIARADGHVHEREAALIGEFFTSGNEGASHLAALERSPRIEAETLAKLLPTPQLAKLFVKTAFLLAYTDNRLADGEAALINEYATALGFQADDVALLKTQVKEFLISHVSHLANVEAAAGVASALQV